MTAAPRILFRDDVAGTETLFSAPSELFAPTTPDEFHAALGAVEQARRDGRWLAGYISYEAGYLLEPKLVPRLPPGNQRRVPLMCLGSFDAPQIRKVEGTAAPAASNGPIFNARAGWTFEDYRPRFERVHRHLREGDCYQANLTMPVRAEWTGTALGAFDALTARQPVRYGALAELGGPAILSRSPELFFEIDAEGWIETHPMKGTMRRGQTPEEDAALKEHLRNDPKNQAENRMIVDLLRNDISLVSEVGTLDVPELFRVESYPTVHQMVSRVRAKLLPGLTIRDVLAALFPCGSITGAPKIRAMEVLRALETQPRDAYCGAIGWIAPDGPMRFSVAIRTITLFEGGEAVYNVGGGLVFDSTAEEEFQECLLKARFATGTLPSV